MISVSVERRGSESLHLDPRRGGERRAWVAFRSDPPYQSTYRSAVAQTCMHAYIHYILCRVLYCLYVQYVCIYLYGMYLYSTRIWTYRACVVDTTKAASTCTFVAGCMGQGRTHKAPREQSRAGRGVRVPPYNMDVCMYVLYVLCTHIPYGGAVFGTFSFSFPFPFFSSG
jgi:hypothetical protein